MGTREEGQAYAVKIDLDDTAGDPGAVVYRLAIDPEVKTEDAEALMTKHPATHLEVVRGSLGQFVGFRAPLAQDRFLQGTRRAATRLRFSSDKCGTWEEWEMDPEDSGDMTRPWSRVDATFRHRRLEKLTLRVTLVRVGRDAVVPGDGGEPHSWAATGTHRVHRHLPFRNLAYSRALRDARRRLALGSGPGSGSSTPRGDGSRSRRSSVAVSGAVATTTDGTREHTSALHALSGTLAGALARELEREAQSRAATEREVAELRAASEDMREWTLRELDRLRSYAQAQVDDLVAAVAARDAVVEAERRVAAEVREASARVEAHRAEWAVGALTRRRALDTVGRAMRGWAEHVHALGRARSTAEHGWRRRAQASTREAMRGWAEHVYARRHARELSTRLRRRWRLNALGKAVHAWALRCTDAVAARELAAAVARDRRRRLARAAFSAWQDDAVERFYRGGRYQRAFCYAACEGVARAFESRRRRALASAALAAFRAELGDARRRRRAAAKMERFRLRGTFDRWLDAAADQRRQVRLVAKIAKIAYARVGARTLATWRREAASAARGRRLLARALARVTRGTLARAVATWRHVTRAAVETRVKMRRALRKMTRAQLSRAFARWSELVEELGETRGKMRKIASRVANIAVAGAFARWSEMTAEAKQIRTALTRAVKKMRNKATSAAFDAWAFVRAEKARARTAAASVAARWIRRETAEAYRRWHAFAVSSVARREEMFKGAAVKIMKHLQARGFAKWRHVALEEARKRREMKTAMARTVGRWTRRRSGAAFDRWRDRAVEARRTAGVLRRAVVKMRRATTARAFAAMRARARSRKNARGILARVARRCVGSCFHNWVDQVDRTVHARRVLVRAHAMSIRVDRRLRSRAFREWRALRAKTAHVARLLLNTWRRRSTAEKRDALEGWRAAIEHRRRATENLRACLTRKRVAQRWFLRWYWDAFDDDIQVALANILGTADNDAAETHTPVPLVPAAARGGVGRNGAKTPEMSYDEDRDEDETYGSEEGVRPGKSVVKRLMSESAGGGSPYDALAPDDTPRMTRGSKGSNDDGSEDDDMSVEEMARNLFEKGQKPLNVKNANDFKQAREMMHKSQLSANKRRLEKRMIQEGEISGEELSEDEGSEGAEWAGTGRGGSRSSRPELAPFGERRLLFEAH